MVVRGCKLAWRALKLSGDWVAQRQVLKTDVDIVQKYRYEDRETLTDCIELLGRKHLRSPVGAKAEELLLT